MRLAVMKIAASKLAALVFMTSVATSCSEVGRINERTLESRFQDQGVPDVQQIDKRVQVSKLPARVGECLEMNRQLLDSIELSIAPSKNPYFLRGDLDGDGANDYVVVVNEKGKQDEGLLVCFANEKRKAELIGVGPWPRKQFWNLSDWDILSVIEVKAIFSEYGKDRERFDGIGESIAMYWEDAVGLIFFDGRQIKWKRFVVLDGN